MSLGIGLKLLLEIELEMLIIELLEIGLEAILELLLENRLRGNIRNRIRNATIDSTPQNNIFREYIFIEVKLLPPTPPTLKPIPIPPSRPNDFKHIAIDCLILKI